MTTEQKIRYSAEQNARLLKTLSETDYAISAYKQSTSYIDTLKRQIAGEELKLRELTKVVACEYADHKKYRDSHMRRFAYKISGKKDQFQETASKEEREWLDAVQHELTAKKGLEQLKLNLAEAQRQNSELFDLLTVRNATQAELDHLYNSIFGGPSPDIPGEDEKENAVRQAENDFNTVQLRLSTENQAKSILLDVNKYLERAIGDIRSALNSNNADFWGVGDTFAEMAENSALSRCQSHVSQVEMLISQAQRVQPAVRHVGAMEVAQMNFVGDVIFDNIFSDMAMRQRLRESEGQLLNAQRNLNNELHLEDERQRKAQAEVDRAKLLLDGKRQELQHIRAEVFDRIAGGHSSGWGPEEQPPSYEKSLPPIKHDI